MEGSRTWIEQICSLLHHQVVDLAEHASGSIFQCHSSLNLGLRAVVAKWHPEKKDPEGSNLHGSSSKLRSLKEAANLRTKLEAGDGALDLREFPSLRVKQDVG